MVGMPVRNLSNHSYMNTIWALPISKEVIDRIRSVSNAVIVCGGPAFSIMPSECFDLLGADLGLAGDAGETLLREIQRMPLAPYDIVGILDDDTKKLGTRIHGNEVIGSVDTVMMQCNVLNGTHRRVFLLELAK